MLNQTQVERLLAPLNPARVEKKKQGGALLSHLSQQDVRAHLIRMFGYGGFSLTTDEAVVIYEEQKPDGKWMVGYRVTMTLSIRDETGYSVATYSESACGEPMGPMASRGDAHDFAVKTASSQAMKRCAINLGDQFGLGLYDKGSTAPIVKATLIGNGEVKGDIQHPVPPEETDSESESVESPEPVAVSSTGVDVERILAGLDRLEAVEDPSERIQRISSVKQSGKSEMGQVIQWRGQAITVEKALDTLASDALAPKAGA